MPLDAVLALPADSVWVVGNRRPARAAHGEGRLFIVHFDGRRWTRTATRWRADTGRLAPDGADGVWITADDSGARNDALVGHVCLRGTPTWATVHDGLGSGISDVAVSPAGTGTVWLSGGFLTQTGGDAAVWWPSTGRTSRTATRSGSAGRSASGPITSELLTPPTRLTGACALRPL